MVFGYYLPSVTEAALTADVLREAGLGDRFADIIATCDLEARLGLCEVHAKGPDGMSGLLITPLPLHGDVVPLRWRADKQESIDCGKFWLIVDPENRPTPTGLERLSLIEGYAQRLGDGQVWQCPVITRGGVHPVNLPQVYAYEEGRWNARVADSHRDIWQRSIQWSFRFLPEYQDVPWPELIGYPEACDAAARALSVNYRIGPEELTYLQAFTTESVGLVLDAAIDMPFFLDLDSKKKESVVDLLDAMRNSWPGSEESTPTTSQAEPALNSSDADTAETANTSPSPS